MRSTNGLIALIGLVAIGSASVSVLADDHADDDESAEIVNELFLSDSATGQQAGEWQITVSPQYEKNEADSSMLVALEVEYGITDQLQVEFEYVPYISIDADAGGRESGAGNFELGLQYSWVGIGEHELNIAVAWSHEFAEGDREVIAEAGEEPDDEDNLYVVVAKNINAHAQAFLQLGTEIEGSENEAYVNVGLYTRQSDQVFSGELNWSDEQTFITPGITWLLDDGFEIGVGVAIAIEGEDDYRLVSNIVYEWE